MPPVVVRTIRGHVAEPVAVHHGVVVARSWRSCHTSSSTTAATSSARSRRPRSTPSSSRCPERSDAGTRRPKSSPSRCCCRPCSGCRRGRGSAGCWRQNEPRRPRSSSGTTTRSPGAIHGSLISAPLRTPHPNSLSGYWHCVVPGCAPAGQGVPPVWYSARMFWAMKAMLAAPQAWFTRNDTHGDGACWPIRPLPPGFEPGLATNEPARHCAGRGRALRRHRR